LLNNKDYKAGEDMEDFFLCAEIDYDDLPWDINETQR
jgi:hypothetical protein